MKSKQSTLLVGAAIAASFFFAANVMAGEGNHKRGHRGPPPEAIEACADSAVDQACEFSGRHGDTVSGTCFVPPKAESKMLACKPTGGRGHGKRERGEAEDNS